MLHCSYFSTPPPPKKKTANLKIDNNQISALNKWFWSFPVNLRQLWPEPHTGCWSLQPHLSPRVRHLLLHSTWEAACLQCASCRPPLLPTPTSWSHMVTSWLLTGSTCLCEQLAWMNCCFLWSGPWLLLCSQRWFISHLSHFLDGEWKSLREDLKKIAGRL